MTSSPSSEAGEGPVMTLISRRLRALRKKVNRISQMEEAVAMKGVGCLNAEQHETVRSKPSVLAAIDELEKIRPSISSVLAEEVALATAIAKESNHNECKEVKQTRADTEPVEDLLKLIYFGATFDLMKQNDFTTIMLTRAHERQSCLSYDTFSNESDINSLCEKDLDLVAKLGKLLTSSPVDLNLSHKNSLQLCVQRAKNWLDNSDQPIDSDSSVTYAELRAKLDKIMTSGYFTATPVIKATVDIAAVTENYPFKVSVGTIPLELQQKCEETAVYQENGTYDGQSSYVEESPKDEFQTEDIAKEEESLTDLNNSLAEEQNNGDSEWKEMTNSLVEEQNNGDSEWKEMNNRSRRNNNNHRGGRGGGRRGFSNGRGARGSGRRGGPYYQNGHSQNYENGQSYPRSYNNNRGRVNVNNNHGSRAQGVNSAVES